MQENDSKWLSMKLIPNEKIAHWYKSEPNFKDHIILSNNLMEIHVHTETVKFYKPIYVGFSILDIFNIIMYKK